MFDTAFRAALGWARHPHRGWATYHRRWSGGNHHTRSPKRPWWGMSHYTKWWYIEIYRIIISIIIIIIYQILRGPVYLEQDLHWGHQPSRHPLDFSIGPTAEWGPTSGYSSKFKALGHFFGVSSTIQKCKKKAGSTMCYSYSFVSSKLGLSYSTYSMFKDYNL